MSGCAATEVINFCTCILAIRFVSSARISDQSWQLRMLQPADLHVLAPLVCCVDMLMTAISLSCIVYRQMQVSGDAWVITLVVMLVRGAQGR